MPSAAMPRGQTVDVLIKDQIAFATAASGNYTKTFIYSHAIEEKGALEDDPLLGLLRTNDRDQTAPAPNVPSLGGAVTAPLDFNHVGIWLKGAFGAATVTGAADPYTHVFTSGANVLPERTMEVAVKNVGGSTIYMQYLGLIVGKLSIEATRGPGYQRITADMVGRSEAKLAATVGGTPATPWARDPAAATLAVFKMDGVVAADILRVRAEYDNKPSNQEHITGSPYVAGYDLDNVASYSGSVELRFRSTTLYDEAVNGTTFNGELLFQKSASRLLSLVAPVMRLERSGVPISGPGGITQTFNFRAEQTAGAAMLTATLKSLVPAY